MADSIIINLDRNTLAELLAGYLYFRSEGKTNRDFAVFMLTRRFGKIATIGMHVVLALIPGLLFDKEFRSVVLAAAMERRVHSRSATSKDD